MALNPILKDMLGDQLWTAVDEAQTRLADDTISTRCTAALWFVERGGHVVASELTYEVCIAAVEALA